MFKPGEFWRHRRCLDTDIRIGSVIEYTGFVLLRIRYWNRHYGAFAHESAETVTIQRIDFLNWRLVK